MSYIVPKEIPMCCGICPCFHAEHPMHCQAVEADKNKMVYAPYEGGRPDWCPLVEVPTPHGRLIDADALHDAMYHRAFETDGDTMWQSGCWVRYRAIEQVHESQPTIIKAEGETDGR